MKPFVVGIAGPSCSGKTTLAVGLAGLLRGYPVAVIPIDAYYRDLSDMNPALRSKRDFDDPEAIAFEELVGDLGDLLEGREVAIPGYDFETHTRIPREEWVRLGIDTEGDSRAIVIIEGLHALHRSDLRGMMDLKVFVDADLDLCLARRIERDTGERGRTRESVIERFERFVVPMNERYVLPSAVHADVTVDGMRVVEGAERVHALVVERLSGKSP